MGPTRQPPTTTTTTTKHCAAPGLHMMGGEPMLFFSPEEVGKKTWLFQHNTHTHQNVWKCIAHVYYNLPLFQPTPVLLFLAPGSRTKATYKVGRQARPEVPLSFFSLLLLFLLLLFPSILIFNILFLLFAAEFPLKSPRGERPFSLFLFFFLFYCYFKTARCCVSLVSHRALYVSLL